MNMKSCIRCLLNTEIPGITIGNDGLCCVCKEYENKWGNWEQQKQSKLKKLQRKLDKARSKKNIYDVLIPFSGGKDSSYVLYLCRKIFNLKCLAVTWDNGFLTDIAKLNIQNACNILNVDHLYFGLNKPLLMKLYRFFFLNTGFFCPVCMRGMAFTISRIQLAFNIPLSIRGTSSRTEEYVDKAFFLDGSINFIENVLKNNLLNNEAEMLLTPVGFFSSPVSIKLPDYVDWNYENIYNVITNELGWRSQNPDSEHGDCEVDNIVNYIRYKKYPILIPEMLRLSKLVTCGQLCKTEAEKRVAESKILLKEPSNLNYFLNSLGISKDEMDIVLEDPMKHIMYTRHKSNVRRRIKYLIKQFIR